MSGAKASLNKSSSVSSSLDPEAAAVAGDSCVEEPNFWSLLLDEESDDDEDEEDDEEDEDEDEPRFRFFLFLVFLD